MVAIKFDIYCCSSEFGDQNVQDRDLDSMELF